MLQLRLLRAAEAEMFRAADRYDVERLGLGATFLAAVERAIEGIVDTPTRWPLVDDRHHRRLVKRFPFSIYYRLIGSEVVVVAVAHHKRHPDYWRKR
jgi:plasmid stabilization system protein ParE